jgi:hypothetical protein
LEIKLADDALIASPSTGRPRNIWGIHGEELKAKATVTTTTTSAAISLVRLRLPRVAALALCALRALIDEFDMRGHSPDEYHDL